MEMVTIILLQNWLGVFKGARLQVTEKKAKKMIADKVARYAAYDDPLPKKGPALPKMSTQETFGKGKK